MVRWAAAAWAEASARSVVSDERTPGRVMTACMVSSRRQTQSWTSWRGRLQSSAKRATLPGTSSRVGDSRPGQGQRVLAEGAPGQVAGGRAELHAEEDRTEGQGELAQQPLRPAPPSRSSSVRSMAGAAAAPFCWASTIDWRTGR